MRAWLFDFAYWAPAAAAVQLTVCQRLGALTRDKAERMRWLRYVG